MNRRALTILVLACGLIFNASDLRAGCAVERDSLDFGSVIEGTPGVMTLDVTNDQPTTVNGTMTVGSAFRFADGNQTLATPSLRAPPRPSRSPSPPSAIRNSTGCSIWAPSVRTAILPMWFFTPNARWPLAGRA